MTILKALPVFYCSSLISEKALGEVPEVIGKHKKYKSSIKEILIYIECKHKIYSLMLYDLSLQPHWSEPATQISFAVMMAGALPHPGSVMETMTVGT